MKTLALIAQLSFIAACGAATSSPTPSSPEPSVVAGACDVFAASARMRGVQELLSGSTEEVWPTYNPQTNNIVFLGQGARTKGCALLVAGDETTLVELNEPATLVTPVYWFFMEVDPGEVLEPLRGFAAALTSGRDELLSALRERGVSRALLMNMDVDAQTLASPEADIAFDDINEKLAFMVLHESVHLFIQYPVWFDVAGDVLWPEWDAQPDLATVLGACYGVEARDHRTEWQGLRSALRDNASLDAFFAARDARRATRTIEIEDFRGTSHQCADAEAIVELEEGGADYIAFRLALQLGWVTEANVLSYLDLRWQAAPHYAFGLGQLWRLHQRGIAVDESLLASPGALRERLSRLAAPE